jgi:hypothetical protein
MLSCCSQHIGQLRGLRLSLRSATAAKTVASALAAARSTPSCGLHESRELQRYGYGSVSWIAMHAGRGASFHGEGSCSSTVEATTQTTSQALCRQRQGKKHTCAGDDKERNTPLSLQLHSRLKYNICIIPVVLHQQLV